MPVLRVLRSVRIKFQRLRCDIVKVPNRDERTHRGDASAIRRPGRGTDLAVERNPGSALCCMVPEFEYIEGLRIRDRKKAVSTGGIRHMFDGASGRPQARSRFNAFRQLVELNACLCVPDPDRAVFTRSDDVGPIGRVIQREHCSALVALEAGHFPACGSLPDDCPAVSTGSRELAPVPGPIHGQDVVEKDVDIQQLHSRFDVPDLRSSVQSHAGEATPFRRKG